MNKPIRAWHAPDITERKYLRLLIRAMREVTAEITANLKGRNLLKFDAVEEKSWSEDIEHLFEILALFSLFRRKRLYLLIFVFFDDVNKFNDAQYRAVIKNAFGATLPQSQTLPRENASMITDYNTLKKMFGEKYDVARVEKWMELIKENWVKHNDVLVNTLMRNQLSQIEVIVRNGVMLKHSPEQMLNLIEAAMLKLEKNARLMVRDQIGKINAELTKRREQELGATEYRWITCRDERVRGDPDGLYPKARPSHYARDTKLFRWDSPPEGGHPGEAIMCRCRAEIVLKNT